MRLFRAAPILALLLSPLYAEYDIKAEWQGKTGYTLGVPTIFDVDDDSIANIFTTDFQSITIYGIHGPWEIPFAYPNVNLADGAPPTVTNTDPDAANELVISTVARLIYPGPNNWHFAIYDCFTHDEEFTSPPGQAVLAIADVDGDGLADVMAADTSGALRIWGWIGGSVNENPRSSPLTGLVNASPTPARHSVNFTLPASAGPGSITITDATGRTVRTLSAPALPGPRKVRWDCLDNSGNPVPAGTYIYRLGKTSGKLEVVR
jgi:hypothetical protein